MASNDPVTSIEAALERNPDINLHQFPVRVHRGDGDHAIHLEGIVEDVAALKKIRHLARTEAGSIPIMENLHVQTSTDMTGDELCNHVIETLSSEALFRDIRVNTGTTAPPELGPADDWIGVTTAGSTVHLEGRVHSLSHRRLAEVLSWWIPGTSRVENRLQLKPPERDTDEELEDAIGLVLERDPSLDAGELQFHVHDKQVLLQGFVRSDVNRRIASRDCWTVPGVHGVDNRIQVVE